MDRGGPARVDGAPLALSKEDLAFHSQLYKVCNRSSLFNQGGFNRSTIQSTKGGGEVCRPRDGQQMVAQL
jgi:hypothetical protein